jgi:hypothetical protein
LATRIETGYESLVSTEAAKIGQRIGLTIGRQGHKEETGDGKDAHEGVIHKSAFGSIS